MRCFGLTADAISRGAPATEIKPAPSLAFSIGYGALSFGLVSALAYSIWAFRLVPGPAALYTTTALVYIGLAGLALSRLVVAPGAWKRFPLVFAVAFLVYAIGWCAFWFGLKGKFRADLWGALAGLAGMTWLLQNAFGKTGGALKLFAWLFVFHSIGYYLGGELYAQVGGLTGRLLWGAAHGLGFGAGLGYLLFQVQSPTKMRLPSASRTSE